MSDSRYDEEAQQVPEWKEFSRPERISEQVDRLFTETLPKVPVGGAGGWETPAGDPVSPMPQADRYSDDMALEWIPGVFGYFLPNEDALVGSDDPLMVDQWVCYIVNYFTQHCGGRLVNIPRVADGALYSYGPAVVYEWTQERVDFPVDLLYSAVEEGDFTVITDEWYDRETEFAEVHGLPHKGVDLANG
ncbi:hypothetical protein [Nocardia sp. NPDC003963]